VMTIGRYTVANLGLAQTPAPGLNVVSARLGVSEDGGEPRLVEPGKVFYTNYPNQPATRVAIETNRLEDLYVVLAGWGDDGSASVVVTINPMVTLIWVGGLLLLLGTVVSFWPERPRPPIATSAVPLPEAVPV